MTPEDEARLGHMLEAAKKAIGFAAGISRGDLETDEIRVLAITRLLEIVGEAARNVSTETKNLAAELPWREIAGTRDRLIHGCFAVDLNIVWQIVTFDLPLLVNRLEVLLEPRSGPTGQS